MPAGALSRSARGGRSPPESRSTWAGFACPVRMRRFLSRLFPKTRLPSRSSSKESGSTERPVGESPSGVTHPAASEREGTVVPDGAQRAAGPRSAGVLMLYCKCAWSCALRTFLLRRRAARRRRSSASRPRSAPAARRARAARPQLGGPEVPDPQPSRRAPREGSEKALCCCRRQC